MTLPSLVVPPVPGVILAPVLSASALLVAAAVPGSAIASLAAALAASALSMLGARRWAAVGAAGMLLLTGFYFFDDGVDPYLVAGATVLAIGAVWPVGMRSLLSRKLSTVVPGAWALLILLCAVLFSLALATTGPLAVAAGLGATACAALLAFAIIERLIVFEVGELEGSDRNVARLTRDLLLGRITSGMLHDLSQPLNVIAMANANVGYIVDRLEMDDERRGELTERILRIASHTDRAAQILGLFRGFGRDGDRDRGLMTVGSALERAIAATRSDIRHESVKVELRGNALDYPVLLRHGTVEMLAVAGLLSAFQAFGTSEGDLSSGNVVLIADQVDSDIVITLLCTDAEGSPCATGEIDRATMWLVGQVAREGGGDFHRVSGVNQPLCFVLRFRRNEI